MSTEPQEGLFPVDELAVTFGPLPAMLVCEFDSCGGHRKCATEAECAEFAARHVDLHEGPVRIGCWPQRPDSLASLLAPDVAAAAEEAGAPVTDLAAWRRGKYAPPGA
jgi:hypothetical protein